MALVVLLRGVNVGGHRALRPAALATELKHLGAVNIGAAGTLVIQQRVGRSALRSELVGRLPFRTDIMICEGRDIVRLMSRDKCAQRPASPDVVCFVSVLSRLPRSAPPLPMRLPSRGEWLLKVQARDGRFVVGQYRRRMQAIGYLGSLDRIFGVPATTRTWNTMTAVANVLTTGASPRHRERGAPRGAPVGPAAVSSRRG